MNPADLPSEQVREAAVSLLVHPKPHWSVVATLLGRISDESLYKLPDPEHDRPEGYESPQAFCEERLDMTASEYRLAMKLWRVIGRGRNESVPPERWSRVPRQTALLIGEMQGVGGFTAHWLAKAEESPLRKFKAAVESQLGREPFRRLAFTVPASVYDLVDAAMQIAMDIVAPDKDQKKWKEHAAVCLEVIARSIVLDGVDAAGEEAP